MSVTGPELRLRTAAGKFTEDDAIQLISEDRHLRA